MCRAKKLSTNFVERTGQSWRKWRRYVPSTFLSDIQLPSRMVKMKRSKNVAQKTNNDWHRGVTDTGVYGDMATNSSTEAGRNGNRNWSKLPSQDALTKYFLLWGAIWKNIDWLQKNVNVDRKFGYLGSDTLRKRKDSVDRLFGIAETDILAAV